MKRPKTPNTIRYLHDALSNSVKHVQKNQIKGQQRKEKYQKQMEMLKNYSFFVVAVFVYSLVCQFFVAGTIVDDVDEMMSWM